MKKIVIASSLLALFFANTSVIAAPQDEEALAGTNFASNNANGPNPFGPSAIDTTTAPQPDAAGQAADDSDSW